MCLVKISEHESESIIISTALRNSGRVHHSCKTPDVEAALLRINSRMSPRLALLRGLISLKVYNWADIS